jgi:hypothetical protein
MFDISDIYGMLDNKALALAELANYAGAQWETI